MHNRCLSLRLLLILVPWLLTGVACAADWPHWLGPNRDGHSVEDSGWDAGAWPPGKPLWSLNAGVGSSSPLVIGDRVYLLGWKGGRDTVSCREAPTGREIWTVSYGCPDHGRRSTGDEGLYSGPTSTPEFDPRTGYLYTLSCDGDLHCWSTREEGRKVWHVNLYERFNVPQRPRYGRSGLRDYGYTTAPLLYSPVEKGGQAPRRNSNPQDSQSPSGASPRFSTGASGDWLIVEVGASDGNLMAFSRKTGERLWASEDKGPAGHSGGPVPMTVEGVPCVAVFAYEGLHVARLDGDQPGRTVARYPWATEFANNIATPAVHGDSVLITSGYNRNAICRVRVTLAGATKVWEQPFASKVCTPVIDQGRVYWAWQKLHCLDFESGRPLWEGGDFADAGSCILTADRRLIVWGHRGRLALVETASGTANKYQELARLDKVFGTDVWPHVVLADGRLYCKDRQGNLKCFSLVGMGT